jgi:hypothetical protein
MAQTQELLTVSKLADRWGIPKTKLGRRLKEEGVKPDLVKAGCSYYNQPRLEKLRPKLEV